MRRGSNNSKNLPMAEKRDDDTVLLEMPPKLKKWLLEESVFDLSWTNIIAYFRTEGFTERNEEMVLRVIKENQKKQTAKTWGINHPQISFFGRK